MRDAISTTVRRVLVAVSEACGAPLLREAYEVAHAHHGRLAVCVIAGDRCPLQAEQRMTTSLRRSLGDRAERVAIFAISDAPGDHVDDCARSWGADEVLRWDGKTDDETPAN